MGWCGRGESGWRAGGGGREMDGDEGTAITLAVKQHTFIFKQFSFFFIFQGLVNLCLLSGRFNLTVICFLIFFIFVFYCPKYVKTIRYNNKYKII